MRILIVDDELLARKRLRTLLAECDPRHQVVDAGHAGEALALLHQPPAFDVVLLDIHMPGQDGMALAHLIQRLPEPPAIVFVTAHAEHALAAFEIDAADYLSNLDDVATCRGDDIPYEKGVTYTTTIDGFIVSDNVTATATNIDNSFEYSDHNPVRLSFSLGTNG